MSRSVPEWIGKNDDTPMPPRVRLRVFELDGGICQCGCGIRIMPGTAWTTDHVRAIINGGENRESNLRTLIVACHKHKTAADVAEKARVAAIRKKHLGLRKPGRPIQSRGFQRSERMKEKTTKQDALRAMRESNPSRVGAFKVEKHKGAKAKIKAKRHGVDAAAKRPST